MPFLKISNADVSFGKGTLTWKTYITHKALSTTKQVQIIDKKDFVIAALDVNNKTFVMHVAIWEREKMPVHSKKQAHIEAQIKLYYSTRLLLRSRRNIPTIATSSQRNTQPNFQIIPE